MWMHGRGMGRNMIEVSRPADQAQETHVGHGEWLPWWRSGNLGGRMGDQVGRLPIWLIDDRIPQTPRLPDRIAETSRLQLRM